MGKSYGCISLFFTKINILSLQTKKIKMSKPLAPPDTVGWWRFFSTVRYIAIFYYKHVDMMISIDI